MPCCVNEVNYGQERLITVDSKIVCLTGQRQRSSSRAGYAVEWLLGGVIKDMERVKIVQRSLKYGEYYKFPLKLIKLLEFNKINIHSLYIYLLIQDYLFNAETSIIYLNEIELAYKIEPTRFMESLELLRVQKLIIYKRIGENRVAVGFLGFNTDPEVEVELPYHG